MATFHSNIGADVTHRGGNPGFVRVINEKEIIFPDYPCNNMFNSLGNLMSNPNIGILVINFQTGDSLQISGTANVIFKDDNQTLSMDNAQRFVKIRVKKVMEIQGYSGNSTFKLIEYSPYNPQIQGAKLLKETKTQLSNNVKCIAIINEASNIKTFVFQPSNKIEYRAGMYATFRFTINTTEYVRTFTISSSPSYSKQKTTTRSPLLSRRKESLQITYTPVFKLEILLN